MKISVVIPSYNEQHNLSEGVLEEAYSYLKGNISSFELLLCDDGSDDGTTEALLAFAKKHPFTQVIQNPHRGKGPTVLSGMKKSTGDVVLFTDFDQATPLAEIEKLLPYLNNGFDIIIGSREIKGAIRDEEPLHRHIMGKGFNFLVQLLTVPGIHDTQCGFKLFTKKAIDALAKKVVVYSGQGKLTGAFTGAFDVELLYLGRKHGFLIKEVPIAWKHVETNRVDPVKDSIKMFIDLLRIRQADLLGRYR